MDYYKIVKEMVDDKTIIDNSGPIHYKAKKYAVIIEIKEIKHSKKG